MSDSKLETKVAFKIGLITILELEIVECQLIGDIKPILLENPFIKLMPNIKFMLGEKELEEFKPLNQQIEQIGKKIDIQISFDSFNQKTAREHVINISHFFEDPESFLNEGFLDFNMYIGRTDYITKVTMNQQLPDLKTDDQAFLDNDLKLFSEFSFLEQQKKDDLFF